MILQLIWRNLWRNRRRTFITMASVTFAVMLAVVFKSLQQGVWNNLIKNIVGYYSGYIQLHKKGYWDEQVIDNSFVYGDSLRQALKQATPYAFTPRIESFVLAANDRLTRGCLAVGVDPEGEEALTGLREKIVRGTYLDGGGAVVAEGLAGRLGLDAGDTLILLGQGYHQYSAAGKFAVSGIARFGSPELNDGIVFLPLAEAQAFFDAGQRATSLVFSLPDPGQLDRVRDDLAGHAGPAYEVMTWKEMMPEIVDQITLDTGGFYIEIGILYLVIAFGIFGTVIMMTIERRYEFGMLVAVGMKKVKIGWMLLGETILISMLGTVAGLIISFPVVYWLTYHPIRFTGDMAKAFASYGFEPVFPAELNPGAFISQSAVVLLLALVIGIYPLTHLSRLKAVEALKK